MKTSKKLTIATHQTAFDRKLKRRSLQELLDEAVKILGGKYPSYVSDKNWLVREGLRAICEAVIREKGAPAPLKVGFIDRDGHPVAVADSASPQRPPESDAHPHNVIPFEAAGESDSESGESNGNGATPPPAAYKNVSINFTGGSVWGYN